MNRRGNDWTRKSSAVGMSMGGVLALCVLAGCSSQPSGTTPQLAAARPGQLTQCEALAARVQWPGLVLGSATAVAAGTVQVGNQAMAAPAHCLVQGRLGERVSTVDGQRYAIGFEMRLPMAWSGRFFYQGNGGLDGAVVPAVGGIGGGAPRRSALEMGFAVLSSDAGHAGSMGPRFGLDPQARSDYGYQAVAKLTPMARELIQQAYGRGPDRSYIGGCSNGGRHAMVAAARMPGQYDGVLAGNPGYHLPRAAVAQLFGAQQYARVASGRTPEGLPDLQTAFSPAELSLVSRSVLARCDALDGLADGIVGDLAACRTRFDLQRDTPTCTGARDGMCLTPGQKEVLLRVHDGARDSQGRALYSRFPFDSGISGANWRDWKFNSSQTRDPGAVGFIFSTPPLADRPGGLAFALSFDMDRDAPRIEARQAPFGESAMDFMVPPKADDLAALRDRGGKILVYHGTSDPVFSADDTAAWYERLQQNNDGRGDAFARYFPVPGMNHCSGGPATDQFDMLSALVDWVERGVAPSAITASARGPGSRMPNAELPADWSPARTRPLCPYPRVATYQGGNPEIAASFACR